MDSNNEQSAAQLLYGDTTSTPMPEPAEAEYQVSLSNEELGEEMYGKTVRDPENGSYSSSMKAGLDALATTGMDETELLGHAEQAANFFADLQFSPQEAREFHGLYTRALANPPEESEVRQWRRDSVERLKYKYGQNVNSKIAEVKSFLKSNPELQRDLNVTGLGNRFEIIDTLIEKVSRFNARRR